MPIAPPAFRLTRTCLTSVASLAGLALAGALPAAETIHIKAITGMHYDVSQFAVKPGEKLTIVLENADTTDMPHNLVITRPGKREEVVNAALQLGADGPALGYVPKNPDVLFSIPMVMANESKSLSFTAPKEPGIYPYVCCFPGHGVLMFGAMYVGVAMPAAPVHADGDGDGEGSSASLSLGDGKSPHAYPLVRPMMYRMFMPGASPAAIAVALPGQDSLCWDAGQCRFRYAWSGGFVDNQGYWKGNGNAQAKLLGPIWYTAAKGHLLRLARDSEPVTAFKGYDLIKGLPEFRYTLDGVEVHELISAGDKPHSLVFTYQLPVAKPLYAVVEGEKAAWWSSSAGAFAQGTLSIPAAASASFTLTLSAPAGAAP
jgi:azurin